MLALLTDQYTIQQVKGQMMIQLIIKTWYVAQIVVSILSSISASAILDGSKTLTRANAQKRVTFRAKIL